MYYALKYSSCLALFVYGCARPAALPKEPDVVISGVKRPMRQFTSEETVWTLPNSQAGDGTTTRTL